jgi:hypothetical protein
VLFAKKIAKMAFLEQREFQRKIVAASALQPRKLSRKERKVRENKLNKMA